MLERLKPLPGCADALQRVRQMRKMRPRIRITEPESSLLVTKNAGAADSLPDMGRLLAPVNAGVNAARHLLWYLSYHSAGDRRPQD